MASEQFGGRLASARAGTGASPRDTTAGDFAQSSTLAADTTQDIAAAQQRSFRSVSFHIVTVAVLDRRAHR